MIIILVVINITLICFVISLNIQFYKEKQNYKITSDLLKAKIFDVSNKQNFLANKVNISEDLSEVIKVSNISLNKKIYRLNYFLFKMLCKK